MDNSTKVMKSRGHRGTKEDVSGSSDYYKSRVISFNGQAICLHFKCRFYINEDQKDASTAVEESKEPIKDQPSLFEINQITKGIGWKQ